MDSFYSMNSLLNGCMISACFIMMAISTFLLLNESNPIHRDIVLMGQYHLITHIFVNRILITRLAMGSINSVALHIFYLS
jgi:hypothetical protein